MREFKTRGRDGASSFTPPISDFENRYYLNGSAAVEVTWPEAANFALIGSPINYGVSLQTFAATELTATSSKTDGTSVMYNIAQLRRNGEGSFFINSNETGLVYVSFYS